MSLVRTESLPHYVGWQEPLQTNWRNRKVEIFSAASLLTGGIAALFLGCHPMLANIASLGAAVFIHWRLIEKVETSTPDEIRKKILIAGGALFHKNRRSALIRELEEKLSNKIPQAKELHPIYQDLIKQMQLNLCRLFDLSQKYLREVRSAASYQDLMRAIETYNKKIVPTFEKCKELESKISALEKRCNFSLKNL